MRSHTLVSSRFSAASRLVRAARATAMSHGFAPRRASSDAAPLLLVNVVAIGAIAATLLAGLASAV